MQIRERQFWNWFTNHEQVIFDYEKNRDAIFDAVAKQLAKVHPDLSFEIGPKEAGAREFVISGSGILSAFPTVRKLTDQAPCLAHWKFVAFRPRRSLINRVFEIGTHQISSTDVQFSLLSDGKEIGVYLFIPKFDDKDVVLKQIGYLLLDEALGEYDVETKVGLIRMFSSEEKTPGERYPITELPVKFDALTRNVR